MAHMSLGGSGSDFEGEHVRRANRYRRVLRVANNNPSARTKAAAVEAWREYTRNGSIKGIPKPF